MDTLELIKKVRKIEIRTRGISDQLFSGEYHSAFKGKGMTFSEVRDYQPGDDVRLIDWNVTARFNHPYVKIFQEERELTVMLLVDVSGSEGFGSRKQFKKDLIIELCAVIAFSALQNNDKIGIIFFSDAVEKFIPPKKGKTHVLRIIRELIEFEPKSQGTDIGEAMIFLTNAIKKKSIAFVLSDFISPEFEQPLKICGKKHDTIAVQIYDTLEETLPNIGMMHFYDPESKSTKLIDTSSDRIRKEYLIWWNDKQSKLKRLLSKNSIDLIRIRTDESYISPLRNFFKIRGMRR